MAHRIPSGVPLKGHGLLSTITIMWGCLLPPSLSQKFCRSIQLLGPKFWGGPPPGFRADGWTGIGAARPFSPVSHSWVLPPLSPPPAPPPPSHSAFLLRPDLISDRLSSRLLPRAHFSVPLQTLGLSPWQDPFIAGWEGAAAILGLSLEPAGT